jgi:hypothetical protein
MKTLDVILTYIQNNELQCAFIAVGCFILGCILYAAFSNEKDEFKR